MTSGSRPAVGIDVGAPSKGYHASALCGTATERFHSSDPHEIARWCIARNAGVVAIDAPCRWRIHGQSARAAERELAADRISCFSTPTIDKARGHAFYTWMFAGHELYAALAEYYPVYTGPVSDLSTLSSQRPTRLAIETFPQTVPCARQFCFPSRSIAAL